MFHEHLKSMCILLLLGGVFYKGLLWWLNEESVCQHRRCGSNPRLGKFPREGNGNPLQYSYLGNPMDGGTWWATVHGVTESDMT